MGAEPSLDETGRSLDVVVVGLDGSSASITALRWATTQVSPRGRVHAVHVVVPSEASRAADAAASARSSLREVWIPTAVDDSSCVTPSVRTGDVAEELLRCAAEVGARFVVVGHRARSHLGAQLVGHVTAALLHAADRPIVIVPFDWTPAHTDGRPVAVGVGVSKGTLSALRWTMEHPQYCENGMILAHARGPRSVFRADGWLDVLAYHLDPTVLPSWLEQDLLELAEQIRAETGADVDVAVSVHPGRTGARLVEAGGAASLLVVGRGEPPFVRTRTIAPYLRHAIVHAPCPIVVVPAAEE